MRTRIEFGTDTPAECDVAVVGGGFGGLTTLARLAQASPQWRFAVFERRPRPAPGIAYGACDDAHLLNVPAARMGAFVEGPAEFHDWLESTCPGRYGAEDFAPRALFGRYLLESVDRVLGETGASAVFVRDDVVHINPLGRGFELLLASGRTVVARGIVLAPGLPPAPAPWRAVDRGVPRHLLLSDPWDPAALDGVPPDADAVIIGSGLTAIDVVLGLCRRGHRGRLTLVSRSGRLPLPHAATSSAPVAVDPAELARGVRPAFRSLRQAARRLAREGLDWHAALEGARPHVTAAWRSWSDEDRAYFVRRLRPFWEIHRHRAPAHLLDAIARERASGTIEVIAGEISSLGTDDAGRATVVVRTARRSLRVLTAARLVNCTGPSMSIGDTTDPLIGSMLRLGLASPDALHLGLRTDADGCLVGADGTVERRIRLIGALRRGDLWETTAVPELREHVAVIAASLARELGRDSETTNR